jgi:acetyl-CoA synthetase
MMGPWLIYATLINRGIIALFDGAPGSRQFAEFVQDARVNMLGVTPTLVISWRGSKCIEGLDWSSIKTFSSTGECSNPEDMLYLMSRAGYKPVIEYCGGTEIGGGYITSVLLHPNSPSVFTTPAVGLGFSILDSRGERAQFGEVFLKPPSIGLSTRLLNRDHHDVYFEGCPRGENGETLRRHGDEIECLPNGCYRAHGRSDDTMNLAGIKVSSAEIERALLQLESVVEVAAVAVKPPGGGPDLLVINAVPAAGVGSTRSDLLAEMQRVLKTDLNPQFKIHDLVLVEALPRTESNKVLRRRLRDNYKVSKDQMEA